MNKIKDTKRSAVVSLLTGTLAALLLGAVSPVFAEDATDVSLHNLVPVKDAKVAMAYIDPDADFSFIAPMPSILQSIS